RKCSSEIAMHLLIYKLRPDVHSVVHAHPPCATGCAAGQLQPTVRPLTLVLPWLRWEAVANCFDVPWRCAELLDSKDCWLTRSESLELRRPIFRAAVWLLPIRDIVKVPLSRLGRPRRTLAAQGPALKTGP
ncbi:MAG: class II aldolase/adducin family protein, partial [Acidobacteria bacterium]|nr:class II aldolase/adducin family protein [Acidobacteriota bacterium]